MMNHGPEMRCCAGLHGVVKSAVRSLFREALGDTFIMAEALPPDAKTLSIDGIVESILSAMHEHGLVAIPRRHVDAMEFLLEQVTDWDVPLRDFGVYRVDSWDDLVTVVNALRKKRA